MRKRVGTLIATLLAFSACSNGDDAIRFQVSAEVEEAAVYEALVSAFEKDHPDADVELIPIANKDDHLARLSTLFAAGNPPEVFLVNFREFSQFVARGALEPVSDLLDEHGIDYDEYFEEPIEAFTYEGMLQCMPQNISSLVVYYNRSLFESAGLDRPPQDWDWDEFRDYARALSNGDVDGVGIEPSVIRIAPFVWANGGEVVDDIAAPSRFTLGEPAAREALEYIVGLVHDGLTPTEAEASSQDLETRFASGNLGMYLSSRRDTPVFREVRGLDWDIAPLPRAPGGGRAGILHSDAYCISKDAKAPLEDIAEFVGFAIGREGQTVTALGGRTVPSLKQVARSGAFLDPTQPPEHSDVFIKTIPLLRRTPVIPTWPEIEDLAQEILTRLYYEDGYTIDDALADLEDQTDDLFEEGSDR